MRHRVTVLVVACLGLQPLLDIGVASAQDRPVVFVHGLASSGATWEEAANRLSASLAIQPYRPDLVWWAPYEFQADQLQDQFAFLGDDTIAVGHSNGGLVSREWNRRRLLAGIITVGTPHGGAPLVQNMPYFMDLVGYLHGAVDDFWLRMFGACCGWEYWVGQVLDYALYTVAFTSSATINAAQQILGGSSPVFAEMAPGSTYQHDVNSYANIERERAHVGSRVGIASMAHNYWWGGPIRAVFPDSADEIALVRDIGIWLMNGLAFTITAVTDPNDWYWWDVANALHHVAGIMGSMDYWWCESVSQAPQLGWYGCADNDTIVPFWSQDYGRAGAEAIGIYGPVHIQETSQTDGYIAWVLTNRMGVVNRSAPPDSTPPPPPSGPGGPVTMGPDTYLFPGQWALSEDQRFGLVYQTDSDLVLAKWDGEPMWVQYLPDSLGFAVMQGDGNFVVYDADGQPLWATGTDGHPGAYLSVQNDGNVVIYDVNGVALWATGTNWY